MSDKCKKPSFFRAVGWANSKGHDRAVRFSIGSQASSPNQRSNHLTLGAWPDCWVSAEFLQDSTFGRGLVAPPPLIERDSQF